MPHASPPIVTECHAWLYRSELFIRQRIQPPQSVWRCHVGHGCMFTRGFMVVLVTKLAHCSRSGRDPTAWRPGEHTCCVYSPDTSHPSVCFTQQSENKPLRGFTSPNVQRMFRDVNALRECKLCTNAYTGFYMFVFIPKKKLPHSI